MKKTEIRLIIFIMLVMFTSHMNAQLITDRPDQTESSSTVGKQNLQIESGILVGFEGDGQFSTRQVLAPTNLFRYGLTKGIELRLLSQFESFKIQDQVVQGISDIEIGAKFQIFQREGSRTEIAFISHLLVPTGSTELSNDDFGTINKLAVSHEINETMGLGYNIGYDYMGAGSGNLTYSLVLGLSVNEKVGIYIEPYGELVDLEDFLQNFDAGLTYLAKENLQFDLSFGTGINHKMNYLSLGCCWIIIQK